MQIGGGNRVAYIHGLEYMTILKTFASRDSLQFEGRSIVKMCVSGRTIVILWFSDRNIADESDRSKRTICWHLNTLLGILSVGSGGLIRERR